ncbi:MAG: hypothetical protein ACKO4A_16275, partial [Gammaproteobacteria bacterium]
ESTAVYDAGWRLLESRSTDSAGNTSETTYSTSSDADGNVTGYTQVTSSEDASGYRYESTAVYDANWQLLESSSIDSAGNRSTTGYETLTDDDGSVTGYTQVTSWEDASGYRYESTMVFDASWRLLESGYSDSAGNNSTTEYRSSTDADGNVTAYTQITTTVDASGNGYVSTVVVGADGQLLESSTTEYVASSAQWARSAQSFEWGASGTTSQFEEPYAAALSVVEAQGSPLIDGLALENLLSGDFGLAALAVGLTPETDGAYLF